MFETIRLNCIRMICRLLGHFWNYCGDDKYCSICGLHIMNAKKVVKYYV